MKNIQFCPDYCPTLFRVLHQLCSQFNTEFLTVPITVLVQVLCALICFAVDTAYHYQHSSSIPCASLIQLYGINRSVMFLCVKVIAMRQWDAPASTTVPLVTSQSSVMCYVVVCISILRLPVYPNPFNRRIFMWNFSCCVKTV